MRIMLALTLVALLCGCPAQTQFYTTAYATKADGTKVPVPVLSASLGQDYTGDVTYSGQGHSLTVKLDPKWAGKFATVNHYDTKGNLIAVEQRPVVASMSSSNVVKAWTDGAKGIVHESIMGGIEGAAVPVGGGIITKGLSLVPK